MDPIKSENFTKALLIMLEETFEKNHGVYLDEHENLFETLASISAEEASIPVGGKCATLAAQVKHTSFFLTNLIRGVREQSAQQVDWGEIWRTVSIVSEDEWEAIRQECHESYLSIVEVVKEVPVWPSEREMVGAMSTVAHTAYHLGEIRQALCTIKS